MNTARLGNRLRAARWPELLEFALLAVLAVALAHWTWIAFTPRPIGEAALPGAYQSGPAEVSVKRHLFGAVAPGVAPQQGGAGASSLRLLGVVAPGTAGGGRAIFVTQGGARKVATAGETLSAGMVLKEVQPDHVVVTRDGAVERIALDRRAAAALSRQAQRDAAR